MGDESQEPKYPTQSPTPPQAVRPVVHPVAHKEVLVDFPTAIKAVIDGKRITKKEWGNPAMYGILKDSWLEICKEDGKFYAWTINDGDLFGKDWIILEEVN